jgi:hypothetical protein
MKKHTLILTVLAAALFIGRSASSQSTPTPTTSPADKDQCMQSSWNTEIYAFCGDKAAMIKNIENLPVQLSKRRVFLQITRGDSKGEVKLYERQENGKFNVTKWSNEETFNLFPEIEKAIFENKGVNCVGEQVIAVLREKLGKPSEVTENLAPPATPAAAFKHSVQDAQGKFIQTEIVILC